MSGLKLPKSINVQFLKCFVGIFISYWLFGIIQEWM